MRSVFNDLLFRFVTVLTMLHQDKNLYSTRAWVSFSLKRGPPQPRLSFWDFLPLSHLARYRCEPSRGVGGSGRANPMFPRLCPALLFAFHFSCLSFPAGNPRFPRPMGSGLPGDLRPRGHRKVTFAPAWGLRIPLDPRLPDCEPLA